MGQLSSPGYISPLASMFNQGKKYKLEAKGVYAFCRPSATIRPAVCYPLEALFCSLVYPSKYRTVLYNNNNNNTQHQPHHVEKRSRWGPALLRIYSPDARRRCTPQNAC